MAGKHKITGRSMSMPGGIILGVIIALGITVLGAGVLAYLISGQTVGEDAVGYGSIAILLVAAFVGTLTAVMRVKRRRMQVSAITGAGYFLSLLAMNALMFGGQYAGLGTTALVVLIAVLITAFWRMSGEKTPKFRHKKVAHG